MRVASDFCGAISRMSKAVVVKPAHGVQVRGERIGVSCLKLLDEGFDIGRDYFFRGLPLVVVLLLAALDIAELPTGENALFGSNQAGICAIFT